MRAALIVLLLLSVWGCRKDVPATGEPVATKAPVAATETQDRAAGTPGETPPALERVASSCPDQKEVAAGGDDTPEGVLYDAYRLALGDDSEEGREAFYRLFTQGAPKDHILGNIWPRVREHVGKYVADPRRPAYTLCRRVPLAADRVKIFVRCNDPRKSDPPTVLILEQGKWRLDVMTP
ncbi:MAG TPA: hypothetical protein PLQ97_02400 [Myxococcota bacterium]|nr:hypothetical protein [Myxococcota bacterium]HQK50682.1 hypothetical protein [Myxococcota bacterium]